MRKAVFAGFLALTATAAHAQTGTAPAGVSPAPPAVTEGPANLCRELVAFMKAEPPAAPSSAASQPAKPSGSGGSSGESAAQKSQDKTQSAQAASGQDGPAHASPKQESGAKPETGAHKAELKSGLSAPTPKGPKSTPKQSVMSVADAERLASANDIAACKDAARKLRLAGVAMPPPLLALAALDMKYQQTGAPR